MNNYFDNSFTKLVLSEGGYVNDPDDSGGETYLGVTRRDHPKAKFWRVIDNLKTIKDFKSINTKLKLDSDVVNEIKSIYKKQYWDTINLDKLTNKQLAHQIFDHAVNAGVGSAIGLAEELVGLPVTKRYSKLLTDKLVSYGIS